MSLRHQSPEIYTIIPEGTGLTRLTDNNSWDGNPQFSPDGSKILFTSDRDGGEVELYVMNSDGTNQVRITNNDVKEEFIRWSPDGTKIVFAAHLGSGHNLDMSSATFDVICTVNSDGTNFKKLPSIPAFFYKFGMPIHHRPDWSPDGKKIVFSAIYVDGFNIWSINADGTNLTKLTESDALNIENTSPKYSPDGMQIAYLFGKEDGKSALYLMNADGTEKHKIADDIVYNSKLEWSPDGKKIMFIAVRNEHTEICTIKPDGSSKLILTPNYEIDSSTPKWSPGGKKIVFVRYESGSESDEKKFKHIWVMNSDGSNPVQLTKGITFDQDPSWQPIVHKSSQSEKVIHGTTAPRLLPSFDRELQGNNELRIINPNEFKVFVGVRKGIEGKDFEMPSNGVFVE